MSPTVSCAGNCCRQFWIYGHHKNTSLVCVFRSPRPRGWKYSAFQNHVFMFQIRWHLFQHCFSTVLDWFILVQSVFDPTASRSVGSGERCNPNAREFTGILNVVKSYSLSWLFWHSPQMFKEFHCACLTQNQHHKICRKTQNSIWSESWTRIWWPSRHKPLSGWHSCPRPAKRDNKVYKKIAAVQRCLPVVPHKAVAEVSKIGNL